MPALNLALAEADGAALLLEVQREGRVALAVEGEELELSCKLGCEVVQVCHKGPP